LSSAILPNHFIKINRMYTLVIETGRLSYSVLNETLELRLLTDCLGKMRSVCVVTVSPGQIIFIAIAGLNLVITAFPVQKYTSTVDVTPGANITLGLFWPIFRLKKALKTANIF